MKQRVLFVCMGNICRSPTAEGVMRRLVADRGLGDRIEVASAGTSGHHIGAAPDARAQAHAAKRGYDLSRQRGRRLRSHDFTAFDMILAMDRDNLDDLVARCPPAAQDRIGLLMRHARRHTVEFVPDPYYGGPNGFELVLDYIEDACAGLLEDLLAAPRA